MKVIQLLTEAVALPQLIAKLDTEGTISYEVNVTLAGGKKNEQQGHITKRTNSIPVLFIGNGGGYKAARRETQPDYEPKNRVWGVRNAQGLIEHKGELYVDVIFKGPGQPTVYMLDGQPIDKSEIVGLPPAKTASDEATGVTLRCLKVSSLVNIT